MAQLPSVGQEQFYSILAANDDMVFMHVDEPGGKSLLGPSSNAYIFKL
jgi:sortilin